MARRSRSRTHAARLTAALRHEERVTPLELFFDLVFVLAITQCTALMAAEPTWAGVGKGLLVLGVLWWSWVGYAWVTSVVDPEDSVSRVVIFAAMGALLVVALCVPLAFRDLGLTFAVAYGLVRAAHIALFVLASRDDRDLRRSVTGLAGSTAVGVGLLIGASFLDGTAQGGLWALALALDMAGPFFFGAAGWKLVPGHFPERHGLIIIIALGESIVAIGVGAEAGVDAGVIAAAVVGIALVAGMWWGYFDVLAAVAAGRLAAVPPGQAQNEMARDAYSYLHFPMVAGIVLVALALKKTLLRVGEPLDTVPACALIGGVTAYLLATVAFERRTAGSTDTARLAAGVLFLALLPLALTLPGLATVALTTVLLWALIAYEWHARRRQRNGG
jgi:low temperature requirement protein LtrA